MDDDIDESAIGTPSPEWWAEALKDEKFRKFIESLPPPPWGIPKPWEEKND